MGLKAFYTLSVSKFSKGAPPRVSLLLRLGSGLLGLAIFLELCATARYSHATLRRRPIRDELTIKGKLYDPYQVLKIPRGSSLAEIKKARTVLMKVYHPDWIQDLPKSAQEEANELSARINRCYAILEERRPEVDEFLQKHFPPERPKTETGSTNTSGDQARPKTESEPTPKTDPHFEDSPQNTALRNKKAIHRYQTTQCAYFYGIFVDTYE